MLVPQHWLHPREMDLAALHKFHGHCMDQTYGLKFSIKASSKRWQGLSWCL